MVMETKEGHNMDDLLVKHLLNEASEDEIKKINLWLAESKDNQRYYEHFDLIWRQSKVLAAQSEVNEEAAWIRFQARTNQREGEKKVIPLIKSRVTYVLRVAAAILVLIGAGWFAYLYKIKSADIEQVVLKSDHLPRACTLPDGSVITLNANSSISYPVQFVSATRPVTLTGEAFFQVTPDKEKPFIITANNVIVRVVGTSFNVKTSVEKTEVIVETGIVEVARERRKVTLKPEQKVIIKKDETDFLKEKSEDAFYNYYRTGKLVCDNTPLSRLVEILNEIYGADIVIASDSLKQLPINTTFDSHSLETTLSVIGETLNIKVIRTGKQIILQ
jgi:transmembrane sensor